MSLRDIINFLLDIDFLKVLKWSLLGGLAVIAVYLLVSRIKYVACSLLKIVLFIPFLPFLAVYTWGLFFWIATFIAIKKFSFSKSKLYVQNQFNTQIRYFGAIVDRISAKFFEPEIVEGVSGFWNQEAALKEDSNWQQFIVFYLISAAINLLLIKQVLF